GGRRPGAEAAAGRAAEAGAARAGRTAGTTPEAAGAGRTAGTTRESARPWRSTGTTRAALTAPRVAAGHHPRPLALHRHLAFELVLHFREELTSPLDLGVVLCRDDADPNLGHFLRGLVPVEHDVVRQDLDH